MATKNAHTQFKSIQDCPQFLRELIAQHLGETVEWVTSRIDSGDASGLELIEESILTISDQVKALQECRAAEAEEENDVKNRE